MSFGSHSVEFKVKLLFVLVAQGLTHRCFDSVVDPIQRIIGNSRSIFVQNHYGAFPSFALEIDPASDQLNVQSRQSRSMSLLGMITAALPATPHSLRREAIQEQGTVF
jgi:hypothetical protein